MAVFHLVLVAVLAGATASFACVVVERRAVGLRPDGRSHCVCGAPIPMYRNIPIVSWVLQRGRAACCGAPIPRWYVVAEAATTLAAVVVGVSAGALFDWSAAAIWAGGLLGTALAVEVLVLRYRPAGE